MDNLCLNALFREIRPLLLHQSVQKIRFSLDYTLVLGLRSQSRKCFVITLAPPTPLLFLSKQDISLQSNPSEFFMLLRQKIQGGRIVEFSKDPADRIVMLDIEKRSLSNQVQRFRLLIRLIPNKLNLLLLNDSGEVAASALSLAKSEKTGSNRYQAIPPAGKYALDSVTYDQFSSLFIPTPAVEIGQHAADNWTISENAESDRVSNQPIDVEKLTLISGLSSTFTQELKVKGCCTIQSLWNEYQRLLRRFSAEPCSPRIYFRSAPSTGSGSLEQTSCLSSHRRVISPIPLEHLALYPHKDFPTMNDLAAELFLTASETAAARREKQVLNTQLAMSLKKKLRLKGGLREDLRKNLERNILQKYSNLLYAQSNKDEKGNTRVRVLDLFDAAMGECEIPLDPQLSLIQNANRYAKLFQKANRAIPLIKEHLRRVDLEISEIHSQLDRLTKLAENSGKPGQNLAQLPEADMPRRIAEDSKLGSPSAGQLPSYPELISIKKSARIFVSSEGWEIWVGRNRRENDFLTFKLAKPDDFWFHVAEYGGSHVVLRNVDRRSSAPEQSLIEAAQLAAYFSQARNARKVEVHYTQRKHVSKPKGSKPGLVRLREHKTISVQPRCELEVKATPGTSKQCSKAEPFIME